MQRKEYYKNNLPHYQTPGQCYFVTWCLQNAVPKHALPEYTLQLELLQNQIKFAKERKQSDNTINKLKKELDLTRKKYLKAFNDLLDSNAKREINISEPEILVILHEALCHWDNKRIFNHAYCIMPNHIHWVFATLDTDKNGLPVYLQDVMHSVKSYTANEINAAIGLEGKLWQKESFDTTIRNQKHFVNAINYTLNNPVKAGLVRKWQDWLGTRLFSLDF